MSATAVATTLTRSLRFYEATIGKKMVMAVTGVILFLYVIGHLIGNLQIYMGPEKLNHYAVFLRSLGSLLWIVRLVLLTAVILHIVAAYQLWRQNRTARPSRYVKRGNVQADYASRTMVWSGPIILAFVVYHLLNLTFGVLHPDFNHNLDVYHNVVTAFQQIPASIAYIVAMGLLGLHLYHGVWSMFQSVGINHPRYTPLLKGFALYSTVFIVAGNISIPVAVMAGFVR
jgi:succinate dehydrogenase / fumarate reductase cytochrome b subunit